MQKANMFAERGPRITHVNTLPSIITLQNIIPDMRNESRKRTISYRVYVYVIIAIQFVHYTIIVCI